MKKEFKLIQEFKLSSESEWSQVIEFFIDKVFTQNPKAVILLFAPMGAGKTTFIRKLAKAKGCKDIASPTFAIHHQYKNQDFTLEHLDLYRLENEDELESVGFWDLFSEKEGYIAIEWSEKLNLNHLPHDWPIYKMEIEVGSQGRIVKISE